MFRLTRNNTERKAGSACMKKDGWKVGWIEEIKG